MEHSVGPCTIRLGRLGPKGTVRLEWKGGDGNFSSMNIDGGTWCSLICAVSAHGEGDGRFYRAEALHNGDGGPAVDNVIETF